MCWINIQEGYLGSEESQLYTRAPSPSFQCWEDRSLYPLAEKTSRDWVSGRNFWSPKQFHLKNPHMNLLRLTPSDLQHQGSSLKGTSGIQGGTEVSGIKAGAGGSFLTDRKVGRGHCPFLNPLPTKPESWQVNAISETISTWLTMFAPPRRSPETLSYPTYGPIQTINHEFSMWISGHGSCFTTS